MSGAAHDSAHGVGTVSSSADSPPPLPPGPQTSTFCTVPPLPLSILFGDTHTYTRVRARARTRRSQPAPRHPPSIRSPCYSPPPLVCHLSSEAMSVCLRCTLGTAVGQCVFYNVLFFYRKIRGACHRRDAKLTANFIQTSLSADELQICWRRSMSKAPALC